MQHNSAVVNEGALCLKFTVCKDSTNTHKKCVCINMHVEHNYNGRSQMYQSHRDGDEIRGAAMSQTFKKAHGVQYTDRPQRPCSIPLD